MLQVSIHQHAGDSVTAHVSRKDNQTAWVIGEHGDHKAVLFVTPDGARQIVETLAPFAGLVVVPPALTVRVDSEGVTASDTAAPACPCGDC